MRPAEHVLAATRASIHGDVDAIVDALPDMAALAATNGHPRNIEATRTGDDGEYQQTAKRLLEGMNPAGFMAGSDAVHVPDRPTIFDVVDADSIRSLGVHGDPTGDAAVRDNPARKWVDDCERWQREGARLRARAIELIGPPVCPECRKVIMAGERTKRTDHVDRHYRCGLVTALPVAA